MLKLRFHGIVLPMFMGVVMLDRTYLPKPAVTWHIRDSRCGGDATRSLNVERKEQCDGGAGASTTRGCVDIH